MTDLKRASFNNWDVRLRLTLRCKSISASIRGTEVKPNIISVVSYSSYVSEVCVPCSLVYQCFAIRVQIPKSWIVAEGFETLQQDAVFKSVFAFCLLEAFTLARCCNCSRKTIDRWKLAVAGHTHKAQISISTISLVKPC